MHSVMIREFLYFIFISTKLSWYQQISPLNIIWFSALCNSDIVNSRTLTFYTWYLLSEDIAYLQQIFYDCFEILSYLQRMRNLNYEENFTEKNYNSKISLIIFTYSPALWLEYIVSAQDSDPSTWFVAIILICH